MGLVDYSDSRSESSDAEVPLQQRHSAVGLQKTKATAKAGVQKLVDPSNSHKIRVTLPGNTSPRGGGLNDDAENDRPVKRAKTSGDFNSFLPAPKNRNGNIAAAKKGPTTGRGPGLGRGVNLKTGAAPAFSREAPSPSVIHDDATRAGDDATARDQIDQPPLDSDSVSQTAIKPGGSSNMFKPLSVVRKGAKKKSTGNHVKSSETKIPPNHAVGPGSQGPPAPKAEIQKPKVLLFSNFQEDMQATSAFEEDERDNAETPEQFDRSPIHDQAELAATSTPAVSAQAQQPNLQTLANDLGLSAAERRQLFGRNGTSKDATFAQFSLTQEYQHNNRLREDEASTAAHNPVRSIAPGKHSLQQLLNAASNQKEALEESFASSKRNKKEAGSRYGW